MTNAIDIFKEKFKGKSLELCEKLDECRLEYLTDDDKDNDDYEGLDDIEIAQELYDKEGLGDFVQYIITSKEMKDVECSIEELNQLTEYLYSEDWQTDLQ
jgi:hypothetical protein